MFSTANNTTNGRKLTYKLTIMPEIKDYPINVLESYEAIEDLLVSSKPNALYKKNSVKSDCLLMILNNLYEAKPEENITGFKRISVVMDEMKAKNLLP